MSDELRDEVEAINSIYGDNTLVVDASADTGDSSSGSSLDYILQLPGAEASSLKLRFAAGYPLSGGAPTVLGAHHSSGGVKGAGARDVRLFRAALADVYQGAVCLFDAVEEFPRKLEAEKNETAASSSAAAGHDDAGDGQDREEHEGMNKSSSTDDGGEYSSSTTTAAAAAAVEDLASLPAPPWTQSGQVVDSKSTFVAHVARVSSPAQARLYVAQLLASDRRIRGATHNITAWRIRGGSGGGAEGGAGGGAAVSYQDCDDDGEDAAGGRLLHLMQLMGVWDAMVVVTRWYGGVKLGPRRFAVINGVARDGFVRAGMVMESGGGGGGGGGGKGKKK